MAFYGRRAKYVPVATRRRNAALEAKQRTKKGQTLTPIQISGRKIATTFWGIAWCENLENYCDFENRMPRGRTYARNGSIIDLQVASSEITSLVSGSRLYQISVKIDHIPANAWESLCRTCSRDVTSLLELMRGKLPSTVIKRLTDPGSGMFPQPEEIHISCSCPDWARMCKHVAATLYGVGHLLDTRPELFFKLRGVDQAELVTQAIDAQESQDVIGLDRASEFADEDLGAMFGIDLTPAAGDDPVTKRSRAKANSKTSQPRKASKAAAPKALLVKKKAVSKKSRTKSSPAKKRQAKKSPAKKRPAKKRSP